MWSQVAGADTEEPTSPIPASPPPSFRSRASSLTSHRLLPSSNDHEALSDAFDADGSDSDEENDGDHRQRLMRGTPTSTSDEESDATNSERPQLAERHITQIPTFPPDNPLSGRVYGGGSGSDGVFANLNAKPESGEKLEEHPPVCLFQIHVSKICN